MTEKSRHIPLTDFLEALQIEYLVAEIRAKIYYKPKDKKFWKDRVMVGKKDKITNIIANNPSLKTIFSSEEEKSRIRSKIMKPFGFPNFYYRDEVQRLELEYKDFFAFFSKGSEIIVKVSETDTKTGILASTTSDKKFANVKLKGEAEIKVVHVDNITRVL